uniref:Cyclic AMP-dependent transcription factor ATF-6 alpha n=1 Tax=Scleropages formosus TaxID=113540 RepID=A0A8C9T644_SCLFO
MPQDLMPDMEKHTTEEGMAVDGDFTEASLLHRPGEPKDAEDLLLALESVPCLTEVPSLDYDLDLLAWSSDTCGDASSTCTDTDVSVDSLSPCPVMHSLSSPGWGEPLSPFNLHQEKVLSSQCALSLTSACSEIISSNVVQEIKQQRRRSRVSRARLSPPVKRSIHHTPKVSIQPKPVIAFPIAQSAAPLQTKTIVIQPVQSLLAVDQVTPVTICPAKITGPAMVLAPQTRMAPLRSPPIAPALPNLTLSEGPVMIPTHSQDISPSKGGGVLSTLVQPVLSMAAHSTTADGDTVARRQQRMIKNRESASLSRKKKKEYLLALEARLKVALFENQQLKKENCSLKIQLDGLISENNVLKVTAPKRRAVCLMVVLMFGMLNAGPFRLFDSETTPDTPFGATHGSRHLLGFSTDDKDTPDSTNTGSPDRWEVPKEKALMVVKKNPLLFVSPPPCQPAVNRTKSIRLAQELRGWVHRHEVERTKKRLMTNKQKNKTTLKTPGKEAEVSQIVTVQYADTTEKTSGSELQVYYARYSYYEDFFEEIHRRGDTFYVVSFRRDHLLLPATSHNKGTRPKMSLVLPAVNVNGSQGTGAYPAIQGVRPEGKGTHPGRDATPSQGTPNGTRTPDPPESRNVVQPTAPPHPQTMTNSSLISPLSTLPLALRKYI